MTAHSTLEGDHLHTPRPKFGNGDPTGSLVPTFLYELYWDDTNGRLYVATGATSADWVNVGTTNRELEPLIAMPTAAWNSLSDAAAYGGVLWPDVSAFDMTIDATAPTTVTPSFGQEASGSANNTTWLTYAALEADQDTGENPIEFTWRVRIPDEFTGWNEAGILVYYKRETVSGATEPTTVTLEAFDPASGSSFGTPKTATRSAVAGYDDTAYQKIRLDGTTLGADFSAGDLLKFSLKYEKDSFSGVDTIKLYVAQIALFWSDL